MDYKRAQPTLSVCDNIADPNDDRGKYKLTLVRSRRHQRSSTQLHVYNEEQELGSGEGEGEMTREWEEEVGEVFFVYFISVFAGGARHAWSQKGSVGAT